MLLLLLESCSGPKIDRQNTLIVASPSLPILLDPRLAVDGEGDKIGALLYDGLVTFNNQQEVRPALATQWEKKGTRTYHFQLRKGVLFSNGKPFTAKDVACTFDFILNKKNKSPFRSEFRKIDSYKIIDDHRIAIRLKEPYAPFYVTLKKGIVGCDGKSGTGPYTLVSQEKGRRTVLRANPNYFGGPPKLKTLIFEVVKDDMTRVFKLMNKEVDLVQNAIPALLIEKVLQTKRIRMQQSVGTTFAYMGFNLKDPILKKKKVRKAFAHALNRKAVIQHFWKGRAEIANSLMAPSHWAHNADVTVYDYNPERAKKLLEEAGFKDPDGEGPKPRFSITYKTSTNKERVEIAKFFAEQLGKVGIAVTVRPFEWGTFFSDVKSGNFQIYTLSWIKIIEPDHYYNILHSSQFPPNGSNRNFFVNQKVDALTEKARETFDIAGRKKLYAAVQKIANEELPFIPLWYENNIVLYWDDLKGVRLTPDPSYRNFMGVYR